MRNALIDRRYPLIEKPFDKGATFSHLFHQVVCFVIFESRRSGDQRKLTCAEGTVMFSRLPDVQIRLEKKQRKRQAVPADGLG